MLYSNIYSIYCKICVVWVFVLYDVFVCKFCLNSIEGCKMIFLFFVLIIVCFFLILFDWKSGLFSLFVFYVICSGMNG